jgi:hypothetical protein
VEICKNNKNKKCQIKEPTVDYFGYDAHPSCMNFQRDEIKIEKLRDEWVTN